MQVDEGIAHLRDRTAAGGAADHARPGEEAAAARADVAERPRQSSTTARKAPTSRTRSSASRSVTACERPASAAARLAAPAAKKVAHSPSSGRPARAAPRRCAAGARAGSGPGAGGQHGRRGAQRTEVGRGVALPGVGAARGLGQAAVRLVQELGGRGGQRGRQGQLTGRHGTCGAHQSCTRTSHQRLPPASQDRS